LSIPPLPAGVKNSELMQTANALHSLSIHILRQARKADKKSGLSPERLSLLSVLTYAGPQSINRLSEIEAVSAPAISRIVSSLESLDLLKRVRNQDDARTVTVHATAKGRRLMETGRRRRLETIASELSQLNQRDLAGLSKISEILEKLEDRRD